MGEPTSMVKESRQKRQLFNIGLIVCCCVIAVVILFLIGTKKLHFNTLFISGYDVQGVDVSHYQGEIDWDMIQVQGIDFAYIKATEGSSHVDDCFAQNWQDAGKKLPYVGAYHFFSFDSEAKAQAELFISTVGSLEGHLVPVVDIEYYGDKEQNPPPVGQVVEQLKELLILLEDAYQTKPMIYTTYKVYGRYIDQNFDEYPLWIRNVYYPPDLDGHNRWTLWQYSDTAVLKGYRGTEKYIDRNVFRGNIEDLKSLVVTGV